MYSILDKVYVETIIEHNPYQFRQQDLFEVAARINKKRSFLFVSKVLGKHLAVPPQIPLLTGALLAMHSEQQQHPLVEEVMTALKTQENLRDVYARVLQAPIRFTEPTLVIGFAETATALGHAFFSACENVTYIHTTREQLTGKQPVIRFEEEHSHATSHRLYTADDGLLEKYEHIVLVDDEMSTGKTNLNIIEQLKLTYEQLTHFTVVSILDWRNPDQQQQYVELERQLGITIRAVSLMSGQMRVQGEMDEAEQVITNPVKDVAVVQTYAALQDRQHDYSMSEDGSICRTAYATGTGRFGLTTMQEQQCQQQLKKFSETLSEQGKRLVIGTGECMYIPMRLAANLSGEVYVQSTTRSPIYYHEDTLIQQKFRFESPENAGVTNFLYNIPAGHYDEVIIVVERVASKRGLQQLITALSGVAAKITVVKLVEEWSEPDMQSSYDSSDVTFLLRDISQVSLERSTEEREQLIQQGTHYAEMLPVEFQPNEAYMQLFYDTLARDAKRLATAVGVVAERIVADKGTEHLVLVSLARAGTPIGILIKRYIASRYEIDIPHYTVSIIRERGVDEAALLYIFEQHPQAVIQFVDGWTGKGAITKELQSSCRQFEERYDRSIDEKLAVLADPGHCAPIYGTRADFLIPSACLNSTVSGLVSRTVLNRELLVQGDFHGAKLYTELASADVSQLYIDCIAEQFDVVDVDVQRILAQQPVELPTWQGLQSVEQIQCDFKVANTHHIKPGVGETTRVLLRRVPWKILVNPTFGEDLQHIYMLAEERQVPVEVYTNMSYSCCGLIKELIG